MNRAINRQRLRRINSRAQGPPAERVVEPRRDLPISRAVEYWMDAARAEGRSAATLTVRRHWMRCALWWMEREGITPTVTALTPGTIRLLLAYAREANPDGRWGNARSNSQREARPATVAGLFNTLRSFLSFCEAEELLRSVPLKNIKLPATRADQIQPFTPEQIQALLDAARRGRHQERDRLIVWMLLDTGLRVSELCSLTIGDVDQGMGALVVTGKGNKMRKVYMGTSCRRFLWRYLETGRCDAPPHEALFVNERGGPMGTAGAAGVIERLGAAAGITGVRCSPHTLRHTFAVSFLRNGGNVLELQRLLGHESLEMTRRYVALAEVDLSRAHRQASPADRMGLK